VAESEAVDNVCHTLVGAALGEAGLKQRTRFATAALLIASNIPDLDVLVFATSIPSVSFRRGWTHGVGAQVVLPLALTFALWLVGRRRPAPPGSHSPRVHVGWLLALSYLGTVLHVGLDYLNNYGVRWLAPVSWRWFYGDTLFIIDPWLWLVLGLGVWLAGRRRSTGPPRMGLILAGCYIVAMLVSARVARAAVVEIWQERHGTVPAALMVGPAPVTPFTREVIVDAGDHYETGTFSWPASVAWSPGTIPKNDDRPEVAAARDVSPRVRGFLVWSRFPYWVLTAEAGGTRVTVGDMRFGGRGLPFSASAMVPGE
jgi:inner membrane protein